MSVDPRIGTELSGYRIETLLGRGGMSVVYLATDTRLDRKVALKLLASDLAEDDAFRRRFLDESELAASIDHPSIVPIYEAGEAEGVLYIAMRYVDGSDLKARLREGRLEPEDAISVLSQAASALDVAHERGLVHRDVKPSNVLIDPGAGHDGRDHAYLADFGLTKRLSEADPLAEGGQLIGTIDYVAPEQIAGDDVDGRADVYSLGCLLFECLTGEPPFERHSDVAALFAHLEEAPPRVTERRPELPEEIDAVVATALAKSPDERYGTCRELVDAAREALGIAEPARPRWLRTPVVIGLVSIALVAAGLASYLAVRGGGEPLPASGNALVRIDPATNEVATSIPIGEEPSGIAVDASGVWVSDATEGAVWQVDPATGETNRIGGFQEAADIAVADSTVFVASEGGVGRIDAATGVAVDAIPIGILGGGCAVVAAGDLGVWTGVPCATRVVRLTTTEEEGLADETRIEPIANEVEQYDTFTDMTVGEGAIWFTGDVLDTTLWRLDPETGDVERIALTSAPKGVAAGIGAIWVSAQLDDVVWRIDPTSREITDTIPVGRGADGVAVGEGAVWVVSGIERAIARIDPDSRAVVAVIEVDGRPEDIAVGDGGVWATTHAD